MQLQVLGLQGLLCTVSVDLTWSVYEAQKAIAKRSRIPVREQCLLCALADVEDCIRCLVELNKMFIKRNVRCLYKIIVKRSF